MNRKKLNISAAFLFLLAFELIFFITLMATSRMPKGHDGFIHLSLQYFFLNHVAYFGDIPLWVPYMTHGVPSVWWYPLQAGLLQNVLLYAGGALQWVNFLHIYDIEMFLDELVLAAGTWLLARRLFKHEWTALWVGLTVCGSCIWMSQPWFNFHFYYCLPLILYLGHRFLDTGRCRWLFLAGNLLIFQVMGNLPYFLTIIALVVFLYFLFYAVCSWGRFRRAMKRVDFSRLWGCLGILGLNLFLAYEALSLGSGPIVNYNHERHIDSQVPLSVFLHYGSGQNLSRWWEMVWGISPTEDYTLYIGILSLPLIILGLLHLRKRHRHMGWLTVVLFLISQGTILAVVFYYLWPMMKYYRHLSLLCGFIKLFLCFLSGAGFESLFRRRPMASRVAWLAPAAAAVFLVLSAWLFYESGHYAQSVKVVSSILNEMLPLGRYETEAKGIPPPYDVIKSVMPPGAMGLRLAKAGLGCLLGGGLFLWLGFSGNYRKYRRPLLAALIVLQAADLMQYKFSEMQMRTAVLDKNHAQLLAFQPMRYFIRRSTVFDLDDPRVKALWETVPFPGVLHWTLNAFLSLDEVSHPYRTDYWLRPLDNLVRALNRQPLDDLSILPGGLVPYMEWRFPLVDAAAAKASGVAQDKIQFFSRAYAADDGWIAGRMADRSYNGDQLYICGPASSENPPQADDNWRLRLRYRVMHFSANEIDIIVEPLEKKGVWLFYSDVWHPYWKAVVNDHPVAVSRADLAYKAVPLDEGSNVVKFYYSSPWQSMLYNIFSLNALFWLIALFYILRRLIFPAELKICRDFMNASRLSS